MKPVLTPSQREELDTLVLFLQQTKDGKYATVEESSLRYARLAEMRADECGDENYFYGLR
jgi:hypothetical protein